METPVTSDAIVLPRKSGYAVKACVQHLHRTWTRWLPIGLEV
jgi:hypothetical protein